MIRGLGHFREHFKSFSDNFILIGGVASYLLLDQAGAPRVRPTKDLDIVLVINPSDAFLNTLMDYIRLGGYEIQKGKRNQAAFYRFQKPKEDRFPVMIELFSAVKSDFELFEDQHIIPITDSQGAGSLSAILLDEEYFKLIKEHTLEKDGISILHELALIPFKAKAYLEIKQRGEDSRNWKKHRGDIINLAVTFLTEETSEPLTGKVREHFLEFMEHIKQEVTSDIIIGACKQNIPKETIVHLLESTFL